MPFEERILAECTAKFEINAPSEKIDVTDWLYTLGDLEYINCTPRSRAHLSAGFTHTPDGRRMSINVEDIGGALIVEHYIEDISEKLHCRVKSVYTLLMNNVFTTVHVIWELIAEHKEGDYHEFTDNVWVHTTKEFEEFLVSQKIPYEEARKNFQAGVDAHNAEEAPEFAASIQRLALKKRR